MPDLHQQDLHYQEAKRRVENWFERRKIRHSFDPRIENGQLLEASGNLECFLTRTSQNLR